MQDPFLGTWILNVEKSEFDSNHRPKAGTMVVTIDAEGYYVVKAKGINQKGDEVVERPMRYIPDGVTRPIPDLPGLSAVSTRPAPDTITTEARREDGSVVGGGTTVISADGRSKTVTNFGYDSQLRQFKMQTVWERQ